MSLWMKFMKGQKKGEILIFLLVFPTSGTITLFSNG